MTEDSSSMAPLYTADESTITKVTNQFSVKDNGVTLAKMEHGTQGDVFYYGATGTPARLGAGTSGQFLKTLGAGANPVWANAGNVLLISTQTVSGSAVQQIDFTSLNLEADQNYLLVVYILNSGNNATYNLLYNDDATATNYYTQKSSFIGGTVGTTRNNDALIYFCNAAKSLIGSSVISKISGEVTRCLTYQHSFDPVASEVYHTGHGWTNTANVTKISIKGSVASSIGIGSRLSLFKIL